MPKVRGKPTVWYRYTLVFRTPEDKKRVQEAVNRFKAFCHAHRIRWEDAMVWLFDRICSGEDPQVTFDEVAEEILAKTRGLKSRSTRGGRKDEKSGSWE